LQLIASGIYHKLKIIHPNEKITAGQKLDNEELKGELTSIFGHFRNTEQFWCKPRSDLNCMTTHHGPATWFLTISSSKWMWSELGDYLQKVSPPEMAHLLASELIAAASIYILDFITSDDCPIGKVLHYFVRMVYQGRGIEHFHILIWIDGAPIIGINTDEEVTAFISKYLL